MKSNTPTFVIELPLCVNDQQNRFLTQAFEFGGRCITPRSAPL